MGQASNETVIDLGEVTERDLDKLAPDRRARWARPWLAAISVAALIGGVAGSAASAPPSPWVAPFVITRPLPDSGAVDRGVAIAGDLLIAPEPGPRRSITAWDMRARTKRWSFETDLDQLFGAGMVAGLVVFSAVRTEPQVFETPPDAPRARTYALDPATGAARWDRPGTAFVLGRSPERLLLLEQDDRGFTAAAVEPASGAELWRFNGENARFALSGQSWLSFLDADANEALVNSPDGTLLSLSLTTGVTTRLGELPAETSAIMDFDDAIITVEASKDTDGDPANGHEESFVVTYDRATMRELWRTTNRTLAGGTYSGRCGQLLCETNEFSTTARDLRTGAEVWTAQISPSMLWARPGGDLLIAQLAGRDETVLLDPATGRERLALGHWRLIGRWDGALIVGLPGEAGQLPWFGLIPATGDPRIRPISAFRPAGARLDNCTVVREWLICWVLADAAVVNLPVALRGR